MNKEAIVGVLGAGSMGSGIAQIAATQEHQVVLVDLNDAALTKAEASLTKILARLVEKEKIDEATSKAIIGRIKFSNSINEFSDCGIVIEAIIENKEVKQQVGNPCTCNTTKIQNFVTSTTMRPGCILSFVTQQGH